MEGSLFYDRAYWETVGEVLLFLVVCRIGIYFLKKFITDKTARAQASINSWLFAAPFMLLACGLPSPGPIIVLGLLSIFGTKTFFRMTGMYHRSWFVWLTYGLQIVLLLLIHFQEADRFYNMMPMIAAGALFFIPILRNSYSRMLQYISLSLVAFIFFGWSFLHMARVAYLDGGIYMAMYIYILTEFSEFISLSTTRLWGKRKLFQKISSQFTIEGVLVSLLFTMVLAWGLRHMLPIREEPLWIASGLIATLLGRFGDLTVSVIRRDLDIKDSGVFIIGRDDILARVDKLIFVSPVFFYVMQILLRAYK
ncbi:MAG: phosphatidate cytidylyltransferase [Bdellovibrionales bacterium]|nr:phosphatidate cytidylyltransferase [Bdellovibrionales bacterium]